MLYGTLSLDWDLRDIVVIFDIIKIIRTMKEKLLSYSEMEVYSGTSISDESRFNETLARFDELNAEDPNKLLIEGGEMAKELFFAHALFNKTLDLAPDASESLLLAARSQHLCRWKLSRSEYPEGRVGYLKWRQKLKELHAEWAADVLDEKGYPSEMLDLVKTLNLKENIKSNPDCQILEDALCIVFLEYQYEALAEKYEDDKVVSIVQKTLKKMGPLGIEQAHEMTFSERPQKLLVQAVEG